MRSILAIAILAFCGWFFIHQAEIEMGFDSESQLDCYELTGENY